MGRARGPGGRADCRSRCGPLAYRSSSMHVVSIIFVMCIASVHAWSLKSLISTCKSSNVRVCTRFPRDLTGFLFLTWRASPGLAVSGSLSHAICIWQLGFMALWPVNWLFYLPDIWFRQCRFRITNSSPRPRRHASIRSPLSMFSLDRPIDQ